MSESAHPYHIAQLDALCEEHPIGCKVVFVPSRQIGYNLGNVLASAGRSWVNLHLTTPMDWAERLVGPRLRADGWRPLVQDADLFVVQSLIRTIDWPDGHLLSRGLSSTGVARAFLVTLRALRAAGLDRQKLREADLRNGAVLGPVFQAYCDWMSENRLYDQTRLLTEATRIAGRERNAAVAAFDELQLTRPAFKFVAALSGGNVMRIGRETYGTPLPQHSAGRRFADAPLSKAPFGGIHPSIDLLGSGQAPPSGRLALREAVGMENEVRGLLRELLSTDVPLDSVEVAYTTEDPYLTLLVDTADRLGLSLTSGAGIPVTCTNTGQSLLAFYRWIAGGFDPKEFIQLCRSRLLETKSTYQIAPEDVGHLIEEARGGRGLSAYLEAIARLERRISRKEAIAASSNGLQRRVENLRRTRRLLEKLLEICPSGSATTLSTLSEAGIQFLEELAPLHRTDRDGTAGESLRDRLLELAEGAEVKGKVGELSSILVDLISEHKVEASVAKSGHLYAVPLQRAGYSGRDHVVVVGMAETSFPGVSGEDPLLLDEERRALSVDLVLERKRSSEAAWQLERVLGMAANKVMLVSNRRNVSDGRETYPSAVFQEMAVRLDLKRVPLYHPVPDPDVALSESELVLSARQSPNVRAMVEKTRPWLASGLHAQRERADKSIGRFDGWLGAPASELQPYEGEVLSASRLEDLAACPYRYFLKYVLDVRAPEVPEEAPGRLLSPLEFGSLLHAVFRESMETLAERGERIDADRHGDLLDAVLQKHIEEARKRISVMHEAGFRADVSRLRRAVRIFVREESGRDVAPVGFEVSFGSGKSGGLSRSEPIEISLSNTLRIVIRGSIDRVDCTVDGFEVWDYKTGSTYDFDEYDLLTGGRRLQWVLYAYALEQLLAESGDTARVVRSGYFFTSDREHGLRLAQAPPPRENVAERLQPLLDLVEEGAFLHVQKAKACTFCDYRTVCASERRGNRDMDDIMHATPPDRSFLAPLERWMRD